jgi:acylphosphatase
MFSFWPGHGPVSLPDRSLTDAGPVRLEATVSGRVQGVGYRYFVLREAMLAGLAGWVANRPDGGVECLAEGPAVDLAALLEALHEGPPGAIVDRVEARWMPATGGFDGFSVRSFGHRGD